MQKQNPLRSLASSKVAKQEGGEVHLRKPVTSHNSSGSIQMLGHERNLARQSSNENVDTSNINHSSCVNHPSKQASYQVLNESISLLYCQKCAILLASQGHRASKLSRSPLTKRISGTTQASSIALLVDQTLKCLSQKKLQLSECRFQAESLLSKQYQHLNSYFAEIEGMIACQRSEYTSYLDEEERRARMVFEQLQDTLQQSFVEVTKIARAVISVSKELSIGKEKVEEYQEYKIYLNKYRSFSAGWTKEEVMPRFPAQLGFEIQNLIGTFSASNQPRWSEGGSVNFSFDTQKHRIKNDIRSSRK